MHEWRLQCAEGVAIHYRAHARNLPSHETHIHTRTLSIEAQPTQLLRTAGGRPWGFDMLTPHHAVTHKIGWSHQPLTRTMICAPPSTHTTAVKH
jgi:hypothetical protein